jgi:hypothetical protein
MVPIAIALLAFALAMAGKLLGSRLCSSMPIPFLAVVLLWMILLLAGFSLMAPANTTTLAELLIWALSVSGAIPYYGTRSTVFWVDDDSQRTSPKRFAAPRCIKRGSSCPMGENDAPWRG